MKTLKVNLKTLTPLWTGDAWGESNKIHPSSIMGSLRFWFEVYCRSCSIPVEKLNDKGVPADNLDEYIKKYNSKESFESLLSKELMKDNVDYNTAISNVFEKINLPLISRIFGCTGWKSQIKIENISSDKFELKKSRINFRYLYDKLEVRTTSSEFWANKLLFNDKDEIVLFNNLQISIKINELFLSDFKKFLKFYEDKIILCGGKKSFGFGFCKIAFDVDVSDVSIPDERSKIFDSKEIQLNDIPSEKIILGFNFKYYQRLSEEKQYRDKNFGRQSKASNFFFSTKLRENNSICIVGFNTYQNEEFRDLINRYSNFKKNNNDS